MSNRLKVIVVGGGIGGLTAALALHRRDIDVEVYERAPAIGEIGAGVTLAPNALKGLFALGIQAEIEGIGFESDFQVVRKWDSGEEISRTDRRGYQRIFGAPYLSMHRADLVDVLAGSLPEGMVRFDAQCVGVENDGDLAVARFADGREVEGDLVIGADGIHSAVRASVFGADAPLFTGTVCWRGLVPYDSLPADMVSKDWHMYLGPEKHLIYYMVRRGDVVNFVAHIEADSWTGEQWTDESDKTEVLEAFAGWHEPLQHVIAGADHYYKWALFDRDPLQSWSRGRVTLLGDSAHAMPPFIGQGAGMSIEDAYVLADALDNSSDDVAGALAFYERIRVPRASDTVKKARAARDELHMKTQWKPGAIEPQAEASGSMSHPIYDYDVTKVVATAVTVN